MSKKAIEQISRLLEKVALNIKLSDSEMKTIRNLSKKLSFAEKALLLENRSKANESILFDFGGVFKSCIRIDDQHSQETKNRPLAYIEFRTDRYNSVIEVIDIIESVRSDARLIGHPVILFAIDHWQKLLIWKKYNKQNRLSEEFLKSAEKNLKSIGKALLEGASNQAISKEATYEFIIQDLGIREKNTYLYAAWQRLAKKYIEQSDELEARVDKVEKYLKSLPNEMRVNISRKDTEKFGEMKLSISISNVVAFLKSDDGKRFVIHKKLEYSQRPRLKVFQNAFLKWHLDKEPSTTRKYEKKAKELQIKEKPYSPHFLTPSPKATIYEIFHNILIIPLVRVCEPIKCPSREVDSYKFFEKVIQAKNQTGIK